MQSETKAPVPVLYGLVRDKDGRPVIDNPNDLHPAIAAMLTEAEKAEYGVK